MREELEKWRVPAPPADIERDLRREFRAREAARRRITRWGTWMALAAGLTVAAVLRFWPSTEETSSAGVAPAVSPVPAATPKLPESSPVSRLPRTVPAARQPRQPVRAATRPVVVEPGQAELLAQMGRFLAGVRQAPPAPASLPILTMAADEPAAVSARGTEPPVPEHRTEWQMVGDEWPSVRVALERR